MQREQKKDDFLRSLIRQQEPVQAPEGFADKVMARVQPSGETTHEPLFSPVIWFVIFLGAAALVATMIFVDIPFVSRLFSSSGIQKLSFDIFTNKFYDSFILFFKELNINVIAVVIGLATVALVVVERIVVARRSSQGFIFF